MQDEKTTTLCAQPAGRNLRGVGIAYTGSGIAFLAVAWLGHQPAFSGVGLAFLSLGIVWLARSRGGR
jgi:hypothetical protein